MEDDDFIDPISLEIFKDPLLAADGFYYEAIPLQMWIEGNEEHLTSPKTGLEMSNLVMRSHQFTKEVNDYRKSIGLEIKTPRDYGIIHFTKIRPTDSEVAFKDVFDDILDELYEDEEVYPDTLRELEDLYHSVDEDLRQKLFYQYVVREDVPEVYLKLVKENDYSKHLLVLMRNNQRAILENLFLSSYLTDKEKNKIKRFLKQ